MAGMELPGEVWPEAARAVAYVAARSAGDPVDPTLRVTLNFHPDRFVTDGVLVLDAMARDGVYRSQFETGTSNGGLTAHPGGDRWSWESRLFGATYDHTPAQRRPKYGALNHRKRDVGGSPRFGSAHFRLTSETLARATFCYPDSTFDPTHLGVTARMNLIAIADNDDADALDDYIEAHIHGPLSFDHDIEALVLDPSHRDTRTEAAAHRLGCPVEWHAGYRLTVDELRQHPDYRGPDYVELGTSLARRGHLDPALLGDAARTARHDDQAIKRVWHLLARYGAPHRR